MSKMFNSKMVKGQETERPKGQETEGLADEKAKGHKGEMAKVKDNTNSTTRAGSLENLDHSGFSWI